MANLFIKKKQTPAMQELLENLRDELISIHADGLKST